MLRRKRLSVRHVEGLGREAAGETGEDRVRIQVKKWAIQTTAKAEAEEANKAKKK